MSAPLALFSAWGVEIEYMIVDRASLEVRPIADRLFERVAGAGAGDFEDGPIAWSNELVRHVVELKTNGPTPTLEGVAGAFLASVRRIDELLGPEGARLLPTGMHPWMDPRAQTELWPHEYHDVYAAYDRVFDCRRHGWANVQSVHLNLPFAGEDEFARLMAAIRLVLPLLPALAASSPFADGGVTGLLDTRLEHYRTNALRVPSMTGEVVPEPIYAVADYHARVLRPIQEELAPLDEDGAFEGKEWLNARGAIARFDRGAIEIRLLDSQECPQADLAVVAAVTAVLRALTEERWSARAAQAALPSAPLVELLARCGRSGADALVTDRAHLRLLGRDEPLAAGALWRGLLEECYAGPAELDPALSCILERGPLAQRLLAAAGPDPSRARLQRLYGELASCLSEGRSFLGEAPGAAPEL